MNQVGDLKTFRVLGTPPANPAPIYVWKWWDGLVSVTGTESGSVLKRLNLGGNPAEGGGPPFVVPFRCDICDALGNVVQVLTDTVAVNNPPTIVGAPSITPNNQAFPFSPAIVVKAYDHENGGIDFYWYAGTTPVGGYDSKTGPINVAGTYYGTLTGLTRDLYTSTFTPPVAVNTTYTCKIVDADSGTTRINIPVQGFDPGAPQFSVAAQPDTLTTDATTLPSQYIAPGQEINFTAFAYDANPGRMNFTWYLYGTNGWTDPAIVATPVVDAGFRHALTGGGWRGDFTHSIEDEIGSGQRIAIVSATNTATGKSVYSSIPVQLIANEAPEIDSVALFNATGTAISSVTLETAPARTYIMFRATATDANLDVVYYKWSLTPPSPGDMTLYGRDVYLDVTDWTGSGPGVTHDLLGSVIAVDRFGVESEQFAVPDVVVKT